MITPLSIVLFGLLLGMRHATDADHVVAVTTMVSREYSIRRAALIGALWGIGHTVTVVLAGGVILWLGVVIPRRTGLALEFTVALMLIALGVFNLRGLLEWLKERFGNGPQATRAQQEFRETDLANHAALFDPWLGRLPFFQILRPLLVGVIHGLAGSAALALLVLPIIHEPAWALAYLVVFGAGTIAGMMLITAAIAVPVTFTVKRSAAVHRRLGVASGLLSTAFGVFLVYQIGFVQGLFTK
jgi:high-affinity nickel-transport protein